jgi:hypothetical protein
MSCAVSRDSLAGAAQPGSPELTVAAMADAGAAPASLPDVARPAVMATVSDLAGAR